MNGNKNFNDSYVGPRPDIIALLPANALAFLDIGCSNGALGASIKATRPHAKVVGMELSAEMGAEAALKIDRVIVGDIEAPNALGALGEERFDVVICADLLEHLKDPWTFLVDVKRRLKPGGMLVTSMPNIRHIDTLFNLIVRGRWPYRDRGIHDRTHLRFFARADILDLLKGAGFEAHVASVNYRLIERPHKWNRYARFFAWPGVAPFLAFQYLCVGRA